MSYQGSFWQAGLSFPNAGNERLVLTQRLLFSRINGLSRLRRASNIEENFDNDSKLTELPFAVMTPAQAEANGCVSLFVPCHWLLTVTLVTFR